MKFSLPHKYIPTPAWVSAAAFDATPEKRALLGNYVRLLSLSWNRSDKSTPPMREEDCYEFLGLKRRQFFEIIKEMEGMRWLRSERPRTGFVQFFFHGDDPEAASAESRMAGAENRTDFELKRIEEEESLKSLNIESSSIIPSQVRKIAQETADQQWVVRMISNLPLLFDPMQFGLLEMRPAFRDLDPQFVLGWIVKAYQDREKLRRGGGAIGLIVARLGDVQYPNSYFIDHCVEILPEPYLEAVGGLIEYECDYCPSKFDLRAEKESHEKTEHPYRCMECSAVFKTEEAEKEHYDRVHDPDNLQRKPDGQAWGGAFADESVDQRLNDGKTMSPAQAWQAVQGQLQMEMPRASFETWVRDAQAVRYDRNTLMLTVATGNQYAADWLENRLTSTVERLLVGVLNMAEVHVKFVVAASEAAS